VSQKYDALDRRIGTSSGGTSSWFGYDGDHVLSVHQGGTITDRFTLGSGVDEAVGQEKNGTLRWLLTDGRGSVTGTTSSSGSSTGTKTYGTFGGTQSQAGTTNSFFAYTGRETDDATGLQYNRNRWYDPSAKRWLSEDPAVFGGGDANLSRYVGNSPGNYSDPSGLVATVLGGESQTVDESSGAGGGDYDQSDEKGQNNKIDEEPVADGHGGAILPSLFLNFVNELRRQRHQNYDPNQDMNQKDRRSPYKDLTWNQLLNNEKLFDHFLEQYRKSQNAKLQAAGPPLWAEALGGENSTQRALGEAAEIVENIPGVDSVANGGHAVVHLAQGEVAEAGISALGVIPVLGGWIARAIRKARAAAKAAKVAKVAEEAAKARKGIQYPLKRPPGVSDVEWAKKLKALNDAAAAGEAKVVHHPVRGSKVQKEARQQGLVKPGQDADHGLDLQYGGQDTGKNIQGLDPRVNRSVGGQGKGRLKHPDGTPITGFPEKK
jgi:RHS repeat-associated protein